MQSYTIYSQREEEERRLLFYREKQQCNKLKRGEREWRSFLSQTSQYKTPNQSSNLNPNPNLKVNHRCVECKEPTFSLVLPFNFHFIFSAFAHPLSLWSYRSFYFIYLFILFIFKAFLLPLIIGV